MNDDKKSIREHLKTNVLISNLGEISDLKEIGEGGNGLVLEGKISEMPVAIKFLVDGNKSKLKRFIAEYINTVTLPPNKFLTKMISYELFNIDGKQIPGIIMKKYEGSLLRGETAPSYKELCNLFNFLLNSLKFIHSNGLVHRDLKPQNILCDEDDYVLADFGIASYNPEIFKVKPTTQKGERLGNYMFSAPEQAKGDVKSHCTMDIYALGQICQWYVTGKIHRGTKREKITKHIPESEIIDFVIDKCLANTPEMRFQNITEITETIYKLKNKDIKKDPFKYLDNFGRALAASFPKGLGKVTFTKDTKLITRLLNNISSYDFDNNLWWTDGLGNNSITFSYIDNEIWLMGPHEIKIKSVWVYFGLSLYTDLVLLNLEAMSPFGIYEKSGKYEEAGFVDGSYYITRGEYDNGFAEVGGEVINLEEHDHEIRCRTLEEKSIFLSTNYSSVLQPENDKVVYEFLQSISTSLSEQKLFEFANQLGRNIHPEVLKQL